MGQEIRISQCMIVKNEEKNIRQALAWGKGIMWEQIVVDTGSADRTAQIAAEMGARVYRYEWKDDFAAAKNFAIEQAKGEWIAFLDADEYIVPQASEKIPAILSGIQDNRYIALMSPLVNLDNRGNVSGQAVQIRFFRNIPELRYQGRIHENLAADGVNLSINQILDTGNAFYIYHTGYRESVAADGAKAIRNRRLIEKELEKHPGDSALMGYMGDCYRVEKDFDNAVQWYESAVDILARRKGPHDLRACMTLTWLMLLLGMRNQESRLREVYRLAVRGRPGEPDFEYIIGKYYTCGKEYGKGVRHLEHAMELLEQRKDNTFGNYMAGNLTEAWEMLALCHYHTGNLAESVRCCTSYLKEDPFRISVMKVLLLSFQKDEQRYREQVLAGDAPCARPVSAEQVIGFLGKLFDLNRLKDRLFILKAARESGYGELERLIRTSFSTEELICLEQADAGKEQADAGKDGMDT